MKKVEFGLDFTTHIERVCDCQCQPCSDRRFHPVGNCEYSCEKMEDFNSLHYRDDADLYFECSCDCAFCRSGIVVVRHTKIDCMLHCYKSDYSISNLK